MTHSYKDNPINRLRFKSASKPPAQYVTSCDLDNAKELQKSTTIVQTAIDKNSSNYIGAILELLYLYGLRISEVLSIKGSDIHQDGSIVIHGSKKSNNRIIYPVQTRTIWLSFRMCNYPLSSVYSRFHIYREFKKIGVSFIFGSNNLYSTTHALRHIRILSLLENGTKREDVSKFIGHKSIKSIEFYEQQFKSKSKN